MKSYDVIVMGGGSAGIIAALASARSGAKTCLIEQQGVFGGTNTTALVGPLVPFLGEGKKQIVDGIPQEMINRMQALGGAIGHVDDPIDFAYGLTPVDFKIMQLVLADMVSEEEHLDVHLHTTVVACDVKDSKIDTITVSDNLGLLTKLSAKNYIDATGDADVVTLAESEVYIGRESDNKAQPMTMCFNLGGVDLEKVRDDVAAHPENFAVSDAIKNGKRMDYVAISGYFNEVRNSDTFPIKRDRLLFFQGVREGEVGVNTTRVLDKLSTNPQQLKEAELEGQRQVLELFKWLKNNISAFRDAYIKDVGSIGVRESRHLVGRKTLTEMDVLSGQKQDKSIAVGAYPIDIHSPDSAMMEFLEENIVRNFEIDLEMLMPKNLDNVLVAGRPISATHQAHAASRVSVTCMAIGQSAGIIAAMSALNKQSIEKLDYQDIKQSIVAFGGIVDR